MNYAWNFGKYTNLKDKRLKSKTHREYMVNSKFTIIFILIHNFIFLVVELDKKERNLLKNSRRERESYHLSSRNQKDKVWSQRIPFDERSLILVDFGLYLAWKNRISLRENFFFLVWFCVFGVGCRCFKLRN